MDVAIVTVGVVLLGVIVWLASRRLRSPLANAARPLGEREALEAERESVLTALQDLEAERVAGALTPEDFAEQRVALMTRGADALRRLDALSPAPVVDTDAAALQSAALEAAIAARRKLAPATNGAPRINGGAAPVDGLPDDAALEAAIQARRRLAKPAPAQPAIQALDGQADAGSGRLTCSHCGADAQSGDRFCAVCGNALPQPRACDHCGEVAEADDRFCGRCGVRLPEESNSQ